MARNSSNRWNDNPGGSKIRVFYMEAENVGSDLTGVAQAIASAFRPAGPQQIGPMSSAPPIESKPNGKAIGNGQLSMPLDGSGDEIIDAETVSSHAADKEKQPTRERKPFKGTILDDIPWDGNGSPFVEYMKQRNPLETSKRYLVIAAWFKRHAGREEVSSNLIYNAYRKMGWSTVVDITQPLRQGAMSERGYYRSDGKGNYAITNIGLDAADEAEKTGGES